MKPLHRAGIRGICAMFAVTAVGLGSVAAVAFACAGSMGETTYVTPNVAAHGSSLTLRASATGSALTPNKPGFYFHYKAPSSPTTCHLQANIGMAVMSTSTGNISPVTRTIPNLGSTAGTGEACWAVTNTSTTAFMSADVAITVN